MFKPVMSEPAFLPVYDVSLASILEGNVRALPPLSGENEKN